MRGVCIRLACAGWLRWGLCVCALAGSAASMQRRYYAGFFGAPKRAPGQLYP